VFGGAEKERSPRSIRGRKRERSRLVIRVRGRGRGLNTFKSLGEKKETCRSVMHHPNEKRGEKGKGGGEG